MMATTAAMVMMTIVLTKMQMTVMMQVMMFAMMVMVMSMVMIMIMAVRCHKQHLGDIPTNRPLASVAQPFARNRFAARLSWGACL